MWYYSCNARNLEYRFKIRDCALFVVSREIKLRQGWYLKIFHRTSSSSSLSVRHASIFSIFSIFSCLQISPWPFVSFPFPSVLSKSCLRSPFMEWHFAGIKMSRQGLALFLTYSMPLMCFPAFHLFIMRMSYRRHLSILEAGPKLWVDL